MRRTDRIPAFSPALAELLARDGELDRILDGRGLTFERAAVIEQPPQPQRSFYIAPPDWDEEHRQFQAREREARIREAQALLEAEHPPERPTPPAPPERKRWRKEAAA